MMSSLVIYGGDLNLIGGVTCHIKRFIDFLNKKDFQFKVYSSNSEAKAFIKLIFSQLNFEKNVIHIHGFPSWRKQLFLLPLMLFFKKKIILTIHNNRLSNEYQSYRLPLKIISKFFLQKITKFIFVRLDTEFDLIEKNKIAEIPAFIEPTETEIQKKVLPKQILSIRKQSKFLITANAFRIKFFNNEDLYGIDLSIELCKKLIGSGIVDFKFLFVIPDIVEYEYLKKMQNLVSSYGLKNHFHFYLNKVSYPAVLAVSDLFLRPTNTDGDAISIREALSLGIPTIASDVASRPEGTILFKNRDTTDLVEKVKNVIHNYENYRQKVSSIRFENNAEKIIDVYEMVMND